MINAIGANELERVLQRYGDDLYRLALLLSGDAASAARGLIAATRRIAASDVAASEPALLAALLAVLPRETPAWRRRGAPAWAKPASQPALPLLGALARLPRAARLALGLAMLRAYEPAQIAPLLGRAETGAREQIRDALLDLAPYGLAEHISAQLQPADVPEECRATRTALALADPRLHTDSTIRGHLALCAACRAAEQDWLKLTSAVEQALRGALREARLPSALLAQLQSAAQPAAATTRQGSLAQPRIRIVMVALPVLAIIALLVWPRSTVPAASGSAGAQPPAPIELVRRAQAQLYTSPAGQGIWHSTYAIQWVFHDDSFALLNADEWLDQSGQHRLQLVHHSGGGPYEYELADAAQSLWYAASENYARSLYPFGLSGASLRGRFQITAEQRQQMLQARLQSGAWGIAATYLRQAETAQLQAWGRQRDANGQLLDLISFAGVSPLGQPPDAPAATSSRITVLLAIDERSGRLREVRELFGAPGSEQTARTTWRVVAEEWIAGTQAGNQVFDHRRAWNGAGTFAERGALAVASMPILSLDQLAAPTLMLKLKRGEIWLPTELPAGTTSAMLIEQPEFQRQGSGAGALIALYSGAGRQLAIRSAPSEQPEQLDRSESVQIGNNRAILKPLPAQGYQALLFRPGPDPRSAFVTEVSATGYSRAELIGLLRQLGPPTLAVFRAQAPLFLERRPHDDTWKALLGALADPPQPGASGARHFVEHVFKRRSQQPDRLADPYHRPPNGGWPEQLIQDNWARRVAGDGTIETAATTLDANGRVYARQFRGAKVGWDYDAQAGRVAQYPGDLFQLGLNEDQYTVLRMLDCDGARLGAKPDGTQLVVLSERGWRDGSCQNPGYASLWDAQTGVSNSASLASLANQAPYLADLVEDQLATVIRLGVEGRPTRTEIWSGAPANGTLLESWERVSEEVVPAARVPADAFDSRLPAAAVKLIYPAPDGMETGQNEQLEPATIAEAIRRARAPLFGFAQAPGAPQLVYAGVGAAPEQPRRRFYSNNSSVIERASNDGYTIYLNYSIAQNGSFQTIRIYQGAASELGAYLRDVAQWQSSTATHVQIAGQSISGWQVTERGTNTSWLLAELEGTLLAIANPSADLLPLLDRLERLDLASR